MLCHIRLVPPSSRPHAKPGAGVPRQASSTGTGVCSVHVVARVKNGELLLSAVKKLWQLVGYMS